MLLFRGGAEESKDERDGRNVDTQWTRWKDVSTGNLYLGCGHHSPFLRVGGVPAGAAAGQLFERVHLAPAGA